MNVYDDTVLARRRSDADTDAATGTFLLQNDIRLNGDYGCVTRRIGQSVGYGQIKQMKLALRMICMRDYAC